MQRIGLLTSGGDSPGMNAAIRGVVRTALYHGIKVVGIYRGYSGIFDKEFVDLSTKSVANIIQTGGTILRTSRCEEFYDPKKRKLAGQILRRHRIDALVVIGGDGSYTGAHHLHEETGIRVIGIPGTIDNDIPGTEYTIGFDTAINTAMAAVDNIRDTASSHERTFLVEVMGRESPNIANYVGIAVGAEIVVNPDEDMPIKEIRNSIERGLKRQKLSSIIIVSEGKHPGRAYQISENLKVKYGYDSKVCILGHILRGGRPSAKDRYMGTLMGVRAVECLMKKKDHLMIAQVEDEIREVALEKAFDKSKKRNFAQNYKKLLGILSS